MSDPRNRKLKQEAQPTIAPGLEMDELDAEATEEEVAHGDSTPVTKLFLDRTPED